MKNVALKYVTQNCYLFIQIRCSALYVLCFSGAFKLSTNT